MKLTSLQKQAIYDYIELRNKVNNHIGSFDSMCRKLNGENYSDIPLYIYFDVDCYSMKATVIYKKGFDVYVDNVVELYDTSTGEFKGEFTIPKGSDDMLLYICKTAEVIR